MKKLKNLKTLIRKLNAQMGFKKGNWYKIKHMGAVKFAQYMGREDGFSCCVCEKGYNAHCFNIWYNKDGGYETWGFGTDHLPELIEDYGKLDEPLIN